MFLIDGTFNINSLNLTLISIISINNLGLSFFAALCFARSKAKVNFDFVFKAINEWIFKPAELKIKLP